MRLHGLAILLYITLAGCSTSSQLHRFEYTRVTMGVEARIVMYAPDKPHADRAANVAYDRLAQLDAVMSDYRNDSELMRLCRQPAGKPVPVSNDLFTVIAIADRVSQASGGAFDITIGPLVRQWRAARESQELPSPEQVAKARERVGFHLIALDIEAQTVALNLPGVELDLGGIGKGYAAHQAVNKLREVDIDHALVALAGDIAVSDAPPGSAGWRIVIDHEPHAGSDQREDPDSDQDRSAPHVLFLTNAAVSTSGSNQQFITIDGTRYSHVIDPRTGLGLTTETIVTVIAQGPDAGALADALSSAACVLGETDGATLITMFPECAVLFGLNESGTATEKEKSR